MRYHSTGNFALSLPTVWFAEKQAPECELMEVLWPAAVCFSGLGM